ncbi:MAG: hypothetical protein ACD_62C00528G0001 [uncultured bacterium]|nr:MAG: hypothetical protein ACD_62C00528G0001 [uncultured bacterium]
MDKNTIKAVLDDWNFWQKPLRTGITRPLYVSKLTDFINTSQIVVITGPRRAGKSYVMRQMIAQLIKTGTAPTQTLMVNFEDPRWPALDTNLLETIYKTYLDFCSPNPKPYLFLDEIQEVTGWEKWVLTKHELGQAKLIISGSNAKLLSRELSTLLTGRHLTLEVFPLSFAEHAAFADAVTEPPTNPTRTLENILEFGSFPEVVTSTQKNEILLNYFHDILYKDIITRRGIRKQEDLKSLARFYMGQTASLITHNSTKKFLSLTTTTIEKFSGYFEEAYLIFFLKRFSFKTRNQEKSPRKLYIVDTGLANVVGFQQKRILGRLAENLVFLELLKKQNTPDQQDLFYWKDAQQNYEVDFIVRHGLKVTQAIQVCWQMDNPKTRERETRALWKVLDIFDLKTGVIITSDEEGHEKKKSRTIQITTLSKWCSEFHR